MEKTYVTGQAGELRTHSRAVIVEGAAKTVYLSGVANWDETRFSGDGSYDAAARAEQRDVVGGSLDFTAAATATFERLRDAIESCGGALTDIVTMTVFLTDPRFGDEFVKIRSKFFPDGSYPASALITVAGLGRPGLAVEIQAIAAIE